MITRRIIILLPLLVCSCIGYAQMMIPVTTTIRTPQGNVPYTTYRYVPGPVYNYYNPANISSRHKFTIELKNDSIIVSPTKIRIDDNNKDYLKVKINKTERIIRPTDTKSISRMTDDGRKLVGIPTDSCWLFKASSGRITLYSFLAEEDLYTVVAMQEGDGPIVKLNEDNLLDVVGDSERLRKLVEKGKLLRAIELYNDDKKNK